MEPRKRIRLAMNQCDLGIVNKLLPGFRRSSVGLTEGTVRPELHWGVVGERVDDPLDSPGALVNKLLPGF